MSGSDLPSLGERLQIVQQHVADAAVASGRVAGDITTVVVTKFQPVALIRELVAAGVRDFGESRHQEAQPKAAELDGLDLSWHFVGQLQTKKARQVAEYSTVIHSIDRESLVRALESAPGTTDCFVQVNLSDDLRRGGVAQADVEALVEHVASTPSLNLLGVMAVAPLGVHPRVAFAALRTVSERVTAVVPGASAISAGMTNDYREAILEGATHLRIGSAITGNRPDPR